MSGLVSGLVGIENRGAEAMFIAYATADDVDATGDATSVTVEFDATIQNRGGHFDTTNDRFQAPVNGLYRFTASVRLQGLTTVHTGWTCDFITSNAVIASLSINPYNARNVGGGDLVLPINTLAYMDANDTVTVRCIVNGNSKVVDLQGGTGGNALANSWFVGELVG